MRVLRSSCFRALGYSIGFRGLGVQGLVVSILDLGSRVFLDVPVVLGGFLMVHRGGGLRGVHRVSEECVVGVRSTKHGSRLAICNFQCCVIFWGSVWVV